MGRKPFVREKILEAAFDLFARRGYEAVSTREIAALAKVGHASMYRHFPSLEDLAREVYALAMHPVLQEFAALEMQNLLAGESLRASMILLCNLYDTRPRALALLIFPPHDFCPEALLEENPHNPRRVLQRMLACDNETLAVIWGAMVGPLQDRYLRRREGLMADSAGDLATIITRLIDPVQEKTQ